jgi:hypothetical protein
MAGLTKNQLAEMVKDLRGQYKELVGRYSRLQNQHLELQMDYGQSLRERLGMLKGLAGKKNICLPKIKESLVCTTEADGEKVGANHGI